MGKYTVVVPCIFVTAMTYHGQCREIADPALRSVPVRPCSEQFMGLGLASYLRPATGKIGIR